MVSSGGGLLRLEVPHLGPHLPTYRLLSADISLLALSSVSRAGGGVDTMEVGVPRQLHPQSHRMSICVCSCQAQTPTAIGMNSKVKSKEPSQCGALHTSWNADGIP